jgi:hypothetical protein
MYFSSDFRPARGVAIMLLRQLADQAGHRERQVLEQPDVECRRWPDSVDCMEFRAPTTGATIVVRRPYADNRRIVG